MKKTLLISTAAFAASFPLPVRVAGKTPDNIDKRPNLLFIMTDQQRFDALGVVGSYSYLQTPNLDRLAREGAFFTHAYSPCAVSVASRCSILTGLLVDHHRVGTNGLVSQDPATLDITDKKTFDQILVEDGYYAEYHGKYHAPITWTDCYSEFGYAYPKKGSFRYRTNHFLEYYKMLAEVYPAPAPEADEFIDEYFDVPYRPDPIDHRAYEAGKKGVALSEVANMKVQQGDFHGELLLPDSLFMTAWQGKKTIEALRRAAKIGRPFSITCSFVFPHPPMVPPKPYHGMYPVNEIQPPFSIKDPHIDSPYKSRMTAKREYSDPQLIPYMTSNYFGLVTQIDNWVGEILRTLDETGLRDNTIIIFTSDHGEMLGSHGMQGKAAFYEESARIPLIINFPGKINPVVIDRYVSLIDLFPTIMDYTDTKAEDRDGRSLRKLIEGNVPDENIVVTEWANPKQPTLMIVKDGWKLYLNHYPESNVPAVLYDLNTDPHEMKNLIGESASDRMRYLPKANELKSAMSKWFAERGAGYSENLDKLIIK